MQFQQSDYAEVTSRLGNSLGMEVVAEGVENEEQRDFLERNGCHVYQGYLFSKPVPIKEFEALIRMPN